MAAFTVSDDISLLTREDLILLVYDLEERVILLKESLQGIVSRDRASADRLRVLAQEGLERD